MDIDATQQPSLEVHMDDDLINYESDVGDYSLAADATFGNGAIPEALQDADANAEPTNQSGDTIADALEDHSMENAAEAIDIIVEEHAGEKQEIEDATEIKLPLEADATIDALRETVADEIDYGLGEVDYDGEQQVEVTRGEETAEVLQDNTEAEEADLVEDKAEISWEDDAGERHTAEVDSEENGEGGEGEHDFALPEIIQLASVTETVEADETESRDHRQDELQALETAISWEASIDANGNFQTGDTNAQFPTITVQYQGDEFPFLSSSSEAFFSESSILDDTMQSIFMGFRSQLKHEVTAEDELVFQIDELGLEFTESNPSFSLTMHQILDVFELLTKNDDPDGRRTLYTYLFTRVNNAKRYEYLVESATSGKGLEEVQRLFSQQSFRNSSDADIVGNADDSDDSAVSSEHAEEHTDEEYGREPSDEHGELNEHHHENHDEHGEEYAEEDAEEDAEKYPEELVDDHQEVDYFDEAVLQENEVSPADDSAVPTAVESENVEADELDNSFAHEHSSTTSTLQGDADGTALADDETAVDAEADDPVFVTEANEDAEIDWRDEDESELVGDGSSVTGKRPRDDNDEPDVDDEIVFQQYAARGIFGNFGAKQHEATSRIKTMRLLTIHESLTRRATAGSMAGYILFTDRR
ncbi:family UPF0646 [Cordyceps militaris]|uniref:Family UPF0646 n=1 Tax=Cordyceps militaris TaxID=73501 RepID=A0A2H4SW18_CORMI|nr:family UPF0646 [Cordyceps militaris]